MSRKLLDKNFCVIPWTGFELEPNGDVKNCIISKDIIGNIYQNSIQDIIKGNSKIRQDMLEKKYPSNCDGCYLQEKHRTKSFESISSRLYYAKEIGTSVSKELFDSKDNFELKHIDLRWSNACNQACVYCSADYSSKWASELGKKIPHNQQSIDKVKEYVFSNIKNLTNVYLAGGEPMLMKQNQEFLQLLYKENPDVTLRVNTNLSKTDTKIFDQLCQFKNVHWTISVETIEQEYEYIRYHGNWQDFLNNLNIIKKLPHRISFNMLYFILNYKSIFNCVEYFQKQGFHNNSFVIGPLFTPLYLNILNLPKHIVNELIGILKNKIAENPKFLLENSYQNLLQYLTETKFYANIDNTQKELKKMDQRRNIDSSKVFPKLYAEAFNK
jgi:MoaA/NifB/PqqE/SkfB family radical SAM enzyme